jgi:hypothetical protein
VELLVLINRTSLSQTVDAINAVHFSGRTLTTAERNEAARWIAGRQGCQDLMQEHSPDFPPNVPRALSCLQVSASRRHPHATSSARKPLAR